MEIDEENAMKGIPHLRVLFCQRALTIPGTVLIICSCCTKLSFLSNCQLRLDFQGNVHSSGDDRYRYG